MSPCLFAIFIDDIVTKLKSLGLGCNTILTCTSIFLYADDIMLISPSVSILQTMLHLCESELLDLDMSLNVKKSVCMRFWSRFNATCANLTTLGGDLLAWVGICHYLCVYFSSARTFKCCFDNCKASFYRSFNAIYGRLGRCASPEVIVQLLSSKSMPVLLYGLDSCPANVTERRSLEHPVPMAFMQIFNTNSIDIVSYCQLHLDFIPCANKCSSVKLNF